MATNKAAGIPAASVLANGIRGDRPELKRTPPSPFDAKQLQSIPVVTTDDIAAAKLAAAQDATANMLLDVLATLRKHGETSAVGVLLNEYGLESQS